MSQESLTLISNLLTVITAVVTLTTQLIKNKAGKIEAQKIDTTPQIINNITINNYIQKGNNNKIGIPEKRKLKNVTKRTSKKKTIKK